MNKSAQVRKGFTLVELLVVIAIIAILAAVVVLIINPIELTKRGRDSARLTDLANLQQAINVALQEGSGAAQLSPACNDNAADVTCGPNRTSPVGASTRNTAGAGWVQINFAGQSNVTVPTLPIDPTNNGTDTDTYHYTYCGDGTDWIIKARLESQQQIDARRMENDGDADNNSYAVGSNLTLTCQY